MENFIKNKTDIEKYDLLIQSARLAKGYNKNINKLNDKMHEAQLGSSNSINIRNKTDALNAQYYSTVEDIKIIANSIVGGSTEMAMFWG